MFCFTEQRSGLVTMRCVKPVFIMLDPATEFLTRFVRDNQDVIDDRMLDPETGMPKDSMETGIFFTRRRRDDNSDDDE